MATQVEDGLGHRQEKGIGEFLRFAAYAAVGFLLAKRFPLLLWWGPDYLS